MKKDGKKYFEEIIKKFAAKRICVIGDVMLDKYIVGKVNRISPEAPVPVVEVNHEYETLGGAANVVNNIQTLTGKTHVISVIGKDSAGKLLKEKLKEKKTSTEYLVEDTLRPTITKKRVIAQNQQIIRIDYEYKEEISIPLQEKILENLKLIINECDAVIISDYSKGVITENLMRVIVRICHENEVFIAIDPKTKHYNYYKGADIMTPNQKEAGLPYDFAITTNSEVIRIGRKLIEDYKLKSLLITRGEHGMTLFNTEGAITEIPAVAHEVYDVSGAGDTVISVLTLARCAGCGLEEAAHIANHAAGLVVGKLGTATVTPLELLEDLNDRLDLDGIKLEKG